MTRTSPSPVAHGSGRSNTPCATLKSVVTAPTPKRDRQDGERRSAALRAEQANAVTQIRERSGQ